MARARLCGVREPRDSAGDQRDGAEPAGGGAWLAAAGAGDEGKLEVLLPFSGSAGLRSALSFLGIAPMGFEPAAGGCWLAAAGPGDAGELDVLLPFSGAAGLRSALSFFGVVESMGAEPAGGGNWLAAAGAGEEGELDVLDCAKAMLALPAMTRAVSEWVRTLEAFMMGTFRVAALGSVVRHAASGRQAEVQSRGLEEAGLCETAPCAVGLRSCL